jgi:glycerol kinase
MVLPALGGLGAPWYRPEARAVVAGLTAAAGRAHVVRATLDGIAHRVADIVETMTDAIAGHAGSIRVDGGLTANRYLLERQADLLGLPVEVASITETTALGVAGLASVGAGLSTVEDLRSTNPVETVVAPRIGSLERQRERDRWRAFVDAATNQGITDGQ